MSSSGKMAKKVELRKKWEERLQDYKEPILYFRSVLIWQRSIDFGVLLVLFTLSLWFYFSIETTIVTLFSLLTVIWTIVSWLITATAFKVPWHLVLTPQETSSSVDLFADVIALFVQLRFAVTDTLESMQQFKAANPTRYVLQITVSGLVLSYIGSFFSGQTLIVLGLYSALVFPGAISNGVPERVAVVLEPHIKVYREKLLILFAKVKEQIDQQIKKARSGTQQQPQQPVVQQQQQQSQQQPQQPSRSEEISPAATNNNDNNSNNVSDNNTDQPSSQNEI